MFQSLKRTFLGPSRDPRMTYISRPLPRGLPDEEVVRALELALEREPNPAYLADTLGAALQEVTGQSFEVLDRSVRDVTGAYVKPMVMIRDGDVGHWAGYDAMRYPLIASAKREETRAAIAAGDATPEAPEQKAGWEPPAPLPRRRRETGSAEGE